MCGIPEKLIGAILETSLKDLTIVSNNVGTVDFGLGLLLKENRVKKVIGSFIGRNPELIRQYLAGELELEFIPQV